MSIIENPFQARAVVDQGLPVRDEFFALPETPGADGRYDHRAFKLVAIVSSQLDSTVASNTVGHMLVALGARIGPWVLGESRQDADAQFHAPLARFPFIMLNAKPGKIARIVAEASLLQWVTTIDYPEEGYTTTHDDDYALALGARRAQDIVYIGAALFGPTEVITQLSGKLSLWRPKDVTDDGEDRWMPECY